MATTMQDDEIRSRLLVLLTDIAPDIDPAAIDPKRQLRDQVDFDSMDRLHFAVAISEAFRVDIPEQDYPQLGTLQTACEYLQRRLGGGA